MKRFIYEEIDSIKEQLKESQSTFEELEITYDNSRQYFEVVYGIEYCCIYVGDYFDYKKLSKSSIRKTVEKSLMEDVLDWPKEIINRIVNRIYNTLRG